MSEKVSVILTKPVYQLLDEGWHDAGLLGFVDKGYVDYGDGAGVELHC
jgi:hypothetical protein